MPHAGCGVAQLVGLWDLPPAGLRMSVSADSQYKLCLRPDSILHHYLYLNSVGHHADGC